MENKIFVMVSTFADGNIERKVYFPNKDVTLIENPSLLDSATQAGQAWADQQGLAVVRLIPCSFGQNTLVVCTMRSVNEHPDWFWVSEVTARNGFSTGALAANQIAERLFQR